jgi:hypothetical protein
LGGDGLRGFRKLGTDPISETNLATCQLDDQNVEPFTIRLPRL